MTTPLWQPSTTAIESTQMHALMQRIKREHDIDLNDYESLHAGASSTWKRSGHCSGMNSTSSPNAVARMCWCILTPCPVPAGFRKRA